MHDGIRPSSSTMLAHASLWPLWLALIAWSCTPTPPPSAEYAPHMLQFPSALLERSLNERILPAPPTLIDFLRADNEHHGFPGRPEPIRLDHGSRADLVSVLTHLPPTIRTLLQDSLIAVFPVKGLGSSAFAGIARTDDERLVGFVAIDMEVMQRGANEWFSWKEATPFSPSSRIKLVGVLEEEARNTRRNALEYILLHEFGHIIGTLFHAHPTWHDSLSPRELQHFPFVNQAWEHDGIVLHHRHRERPPIPGKLNYYRPVADKPDAERMIEFYRWLAKSNFPTLYATIDMYDDFAESFATYVHSIMLGKPWHIALVKDGREVMTLTTCWTQERCAAKRVELEKILNQSRDHVSL